MPRLVLKPALPRSCESCKSFMQFSCLQIKKCSHLDTVTNVLTSCDLSANNLSESFTISDPRTRGIRGPVDTCGTVQFPGFQYLPKNAKTSKLCPAHHSRTRKRAITTVGNQAQDPTDEDEDDMWQMRQNKIYRHTHTHELFQTHGYHHSDRNAGFFPEFAVKHSKAGAELCSPKQARTSVALRPGMAICAAALNNPSFFLSVV